MSEPAQSALEALRAAARAEKSQALFYRALAARAESVSPALAERLNGLLADEQHHLSRLVARLLELDAPVVVGRPVQPDIDLADWESVAREREREEIERYAAMLELDLDARTRALVEEFLTVERQHEARLGGKWMGA